MTSPAFSFKGTLKKIGLSLFLALLTAFSTWALTLPDSVDFGVYAPVVGAIITVLVNMARVYVKKYE